MEHTWVATLHIIPVCLFFIFLMGSTVTQVVKFWNCDQEATCSKPTGGARCVLEQDTLS